MADDPEVEVVQAEQVKRVVPYAPYPFSANVGAAEFASGSLMVVMEMQDMGGDRTYFMEPEQAVILGQWLLKTGRNVSIDLDRKARLVGPDGKKLVL